VEAGSVAFIPGNEPHQIRNTGENKLVFVCLIPAGAPEM
jgi:quercetin dioxygenase-like cupin family protein